ncbi:MAG: hydroxyacylglutathione hydrolase [Betaproteobacteria bacterium]
MIAIIPIPAFADNYIWLLHDHGRATVVDPGDAGPVLEVLTRERLTLTSILTTHHHGDHVGGVEALLARFPVPVFGPARERIPGRTRALVQDDVVEVPGLPLCFTVFEVPGHTAGHIAYFGKVNAIPSLFCGDTLFAGGCGRLFEGTPAQMWASLSACAGLPMTTLVYCAHEYTVANLRFAAAVEPNNSAITARQLVEADKRAQGVPTVPSILDVEIATNPFLRAGVPGVKDAAQRHAGHVLDGDVAVFAQLREWKNHF